MPYGLILVIAVIALAARHFNYERASTRSKRLVVTLTVVSFVALVLLPRWLLIAAALQLGVCVYVILHRTVADELARREDP